MLEQARAEADAELVGGTGPAVLVTGSDGWHQGIVGLLASRLKDHARRPGLRHRLQPERRGHRLGPLRAGLRPRPAVCATPSRSA